MQELQNSKLLNMILDLARALCKEYGCLGLTRDYIVAAAIMTFSRDAKMLEDIEREEYRRTRRLLEPFTWDAQALLPVLRAWSGRDVPLSERTILSVQKAKAAREAQQGLLTADIYLKIILSEGTEAIKGLRKSEASTARETPAAQEAPISPKDSQNLQDESETLCAAGMEIPDDEDDAAPKREDTGMDAIIARARKLQTVLHRTVLGQEFAVSTFASGYFQSELQAAIERERTRPRATFLFAGPPGVGKTFLSEEAAKVLRLPFRRFDMSEYNTSAGVYKLIGMHSGFQGSTEGLLTGFVSENPRCVLLFDEVEKASLEVIHLFLQVLDAGHLTDGRTDRKVAFRDTILIFTTNAGRKLYEEEGGGNLSALSREVILEALGSEINPRTGMPFFPAAICSRFATGNVVMFNHLGAHSLRSIVARQLGALAANIESAMNIAVEMDESVATAILLAEGASADARTVRSRANAFFSGELYELYRLLASPKTKAATSGIRRIRFCVDTENAPKEVSRLFVPEDRIHVLAYSQATGGIASDDPDMPVVHCVSTLDEAKAVLDRENIQLMLCDLLSGMPGGEGAFLNHEDISSPARDFLHEILLRYPSMPILLTETSERSFSGEEKESYLRRGVRGFISMDSEGMAERFKEQTDVIFQQNSLAQLARANRLVRFETAQRVLDGGKSAEVILFDMKLEKAVKAGDSKNVLSLLSTPNQRFEDVIGADDAKEELKFFVSYMKEPRRFRRMGAAAPKGVLLYGPPGTGKTMLAKAFAAESGATFIATEGNRFISGYVGKGAAMVHRLFATARRYAPSVLFIDEIDTIIKERTGRDTDMAQDLEQILTALLAEMDGFANDPSKPVFVLGATNYQVDPGAKMSLDAAALRRFDRRILIDLPGLKDRKNFLLRQTQNRPIFNISEQWLDSLADRSAGMSLAKLTSVLDMAVRKAMQKDEPCVTGEDLDEAFEEFNSGEKREWKPEIRLRTARHEAGHTLLNWLSGNRPSYVTIVSRGNYGGYMQQGDQEERSGYTKKELLDRIRTALGGRAAEIVYYGNEDGIATGASGDLQQATQIAQSMLCTYGMYEEFGMAVVQSAKEGMSVGLREAVNGILKEQLDLAVQILTRHRDALDALVGHLIEFNSLKGKDIDNLLTPML